MYAIKIKDDYHRCDDGEVMLFIYAEHADNYISLLDLAGWAKKDDCEVISFQAAQVLDGEVIH